MKLAEALAERASLQRILDQLRTRARENARHQQGTEPIEDPTTLMTEFDRLSSVLADLTRRINALNLSTEVAPGLTMTAALAQREDLIRRSRLRQEVADSAGALVERFTRNEIVIQPSVDVPAIRKEIDALAKEARALDAQIQSTNWTTEFP